MEFISALSQNGHFFIFDMPDLKPIYFVRSNDELSVLWGKCMLAYLDKDMLERFKAGIQASMGGSE